MNAFVHASEICLFARGLCNTNDMDFAWRMNNARFLKDCDFGRYQLWVENGVWDLVRKLGGSMALGASCARYRRSIYLFEAYTISTKASLLKTYIAC